MKYYIVTSEVADKLGVKTFRVGNDQVGYLVNNADLGHTVNPDSDGVQEVERETARQFSITYR